jgi:putative two-component system response regulator
VSDRLKILVAEDEPAMRSLMSSILEDRGDLNVALASNGEEALTKVIRDCPDVLITDLKMPRMSGEDLSTRALALRPELTVLVTTGNGTLEGAIQLMRMGVFDYITKPFLVSDFLASVDRAVEKVRASPISRDSQAIIRALLTALETKDPYLKNHSARVASRSRKLALDLGLPPDEILIVERAALVHDLGKIGVPENILHKPGPLTPEEFLQIKKHPGYSTEIVRPLTEFQPCLPYILHHHERLDGSGYPDGLAGDAIPLGARIIATCDAFDAMASDRPYRPALPRPVILTNLLVARGKQLDGHLVEVFLKNLEGR